MSDKQTTKECPECGNTNLAKIATHDIKYCSDCNTEIPWYKEEGESPLYGN